MASSTRKSLAGSAAAAAKKVIGLRPGATAPEESVTTVPDEAPATPTKASVKKAPAKGTAKKSVGATTVAKKPAATRTTTTKKAAVKKTTVTSAPRAKVTKKAPMSSLVVKADEEGWTKAELDEVLHELHEQRDKLVLVLDEAEHELAGLMRDAGDGAGHDQADMGATSFERDHELTVLNLERDMLAQIDRALGHIDDGSYGICESCDQPIGKMRLMAFPRATLCMTCKQREERR